MLEGGVSATWYVSASFILAIFIYIAVTNIHST
jgi:hypothetical protein